MSCIPALLMRTSVAFGKALQTLGDMLGDRMHDAFAEQTADEALRDGSLWDAEQLAQREAEQRVQRDAWDEHTAAGLADAAEAVIESGQDIGGRWAAELFPQHTKTCAASVSLPRQGVSREPPAGQSDLALPWEVDDLADDSGRDLADVRRFGFPWGVLDDWGVVIGRFDTETQARAVVAAVNASARNHQPGGAVEAVDGDLPTVDRPDLFDK